jgi:chromosome segregation protein
MLTSLELFGFKSFADRTLFEFSPGVTCVVGPNGSGKSNVVDAIKWILGDQSPKSLRGKEMSDVIFNGSSGRKPSGFAEATLTFDNSTGYLAFDAAEVRVGRRLYQSGDSEYLLNGNAVRLKDVREMFMGSGAGTAAYSIIEQGRVDQILQANPTTRRIVFEEAAGISKYKSRKVDAERKLEKVAQNLLRLTDIVDEVEAQLTATRSQASKAAKFRELTTELKEKWTGLAADDFRCLNGEIAALERQDEQRHEELTSLSERVSEVEAERQEIDHELAELDDQLRVVERLAAALREQIASQESTIRHQSSRDAELGAELERLRGDRMALSAQASAVVRDLEETSQRLAEFEARVARQRNALAERNSLCSELQETLRAREAVLQQGRTEQQSLRQQITEEEHVAARLQSQSEGLEDAIKATGEQILRLRSQLRTAVDELELRRSEAAGVEAQQRELRTKLDAAESHRQKTADALTAMEQLLRDKSERRSAAVARIHVLEDLELRQEGIGIGVREILRRAHDSPHAPWNEILGSVSDLLQVALDKAPLLEVALGPRSQSIVVRRLAPIVDYLNRELAPISGRVAFIELGRKAALSNGAVDLSSEPAVVARADELAEAIPEAAGLAAQLLADTWIVETLDAAVRLAETHPAQRFVTLQGELVDRDGTLSAGTIPNTTALVSRRSELRDLKHEIIRLDRDLKSGAEQVEDLKRELERISGEAASFDTELRKGMELAAEVRSAVEMQRREVGRSEDVLAGAEQQEDSQRTQLVSLQAKVAACVETQAELRTRMKEVGEQVHEAERQVDGVREQMTQVRDELKQQQLELATHDERLTGLREMHQRLLAEQEQRAARKRQADLRLAEVKESLRTARLTILRTRAELDLATLEVEAHGREAAKLVASRGERRAQRTALSKDEEALHRRRRTLQDETHHGEIRLRELRHNLQTLAERIQEEYQVGLPEIVATGASAFLALVQDRHPEFQLEGDEGTAASGDIDFPRLYEDAPVRFRETREELDEQVNRLRRKIKLLGGVNTDALNELDELEGRFNHLSAQLQDLQEAKGALEDIIRRINKESRRIFIETFDQIREHFRVLYRKLFGGGEGDIILEDPEDVLECGIDIVARPPGKELRSISLLSGGEKTMTAVALLFAMFKTKPGPYCILDEVDAALDEANVDRYVSVVKEFAERTQFVVITHRKRTMTAANVLYGVTMEQAGVSKRMSVRFDDVNDDGHFKTQANAA